MAHLIQRGHSCPAAEFIRHICLERIAIENSINAMNRATRFTNPNVKSKKAAKHFCLAFTHSEKMVLKIEELSEELDRLVRTECAMGCVGKLEPFRLYLCTSYDVIYEALENGLRAHNVTLIPIEPVHHSLSHDLLAERFLPKAATVGSTDSESTDQDGSENFPTTQLAQAKAGSSTTFGGAGRILSLPVGIIRACPPNRFNGNYDSLLE